MSKYNQSFSQLGIEISDTSHDLNHLYVGTWKDDLYDGWGKLEFGTIGDTYEGQFVAGKMDGSGVFRFDSGLCCMLVSGVMFEFFVVYFSFLFLFSTFLAIDRSCCCDFDALFCLHLLALAISLPTVSQPHEREQSEVEVSGKPLYLKLAQYLKDMKEYEQALRRYDILLKIDPEDVGVINLVGIVLMDSLDRYEGI